MNIDTMNVASDQIVSGKDHHINNQQDQSLKQINNAKNGAMTPTPLYVCYLLKSSL
jgi:hypothetical protein